MIVWREWEVEQPKENDEIILLDRHSKSKYPCSYEFKGYLVEYDAKGKPGRLTTNDDDGGGGNYLYFHEMKDGYYWWCLAEEFKQVVGSLL